MKNLKVYHKGLIVVDMVNGFVREGGLHDKRIEAVIPYQKKLLDQYVKDGEIYIGSEKILKCENKVEDQEVVIAIRPEGFIVHGDDSEYGFTSNADLIEVLGRDLSLVCKNPHCLKPSYKVIINSENDINIGKVRFGVKKNKTFIFDKNTQERIYY